MNYIYQSDPAQGEQAERRGLEQLLGELESGDCLAVARLSVAADSVQAFLTLLDTLDERGIRFRAVEEGLDTGTPEGQTAVKLLRAVVKLDEGQEKEASPKGRKPIEVDEKLFDEILERWKNGEITARQAMAELNLKPNTFYRRVKEREDKSSDTILDAAKKLGKEIVDTVTEGTQAAGKAVADYDISTITDTVKKNITAAGKAFSRGMDTLSRDFQEAVRKQQEKAKSTAQETVDAREDAEPAESTEPAEPAEPVQTAEPVQPAEATEPAQPAEPCAETPVPEQPSQPDTQEPEQE